MDRGSSTASSSSVGSPIVQNEWELPRQPMNQVEFDKRYEYSRIEGRNPLKTAASQYSTRFISPFISASSFWRTVLGFLPILRWLPRYDVKENLLHDVIGGFMVGIMHVPQGIAYAILAGVHPVVGLYSSFFPVLTYMLFGTSRHASIGSFAVVALMSGQTIRRLSKSSEANISHLGEHFPHGVYDPVEVASALTFVIGLTQIIVGAIGLDFVTTYFSEQLVTGFTTGASVHVFVTQLKDITGIYGTPRRAGVGNAILRTYDVINEIHRLNWTTLTISFLTIMMLLTGKKIVNPIVKQSSPIPIPFELLIVILGTVFSAALELRSEYNVAIVGYIPTGLPLPSLPDLRLLPYLLKDAISISVVIIAVHISMAKLLAKKYQYTIDTKQEFYATGFTSLLSSFFPVFPSSCSLARTLVNASAGSKTQLFAAFSSLFVFSVVEFSGAWLRALPMCILASIIVVALLDMFTKFQQLPKIWTVSKVDCTIWIVAFMATACVDVMDGLAIAVSFALLTTVFRSQWPEWHILVNVNGTMDYKDVERYQYVNFAQGVCIIRYDAPLLFTNVEHFRAVIETISSEWNNTSCNTLHNEDIVVIREEKNIAPSQSSLEPNRFLVIDCSGLVYVDMMGVNCLREIFEDLLRRNIRVLFAAPKAPVLELFETAGLYSTVRKSNFYPTIHDAVFFAQNKRNRAALAWMQSRDGSYESVMLSGESSPHSNDMLDNRKINSRWYSFDITATLDRKDTILHKSVYL